MRPEPCNTTAYVADAPVSYKAVRKMFDEQRRMLVAKLEAILEDVARSCSRCGERHSPSWTNGSRASACIRPATYSATRSASRRDVNRPWPMAGPGVVAEQRDQARLAARDRTDTVDRVAAREQRERAGCEVE